MCQRTFWNLLWRRLWFLVLLLSQWKRDMAKVKPSTPPWVNAWRDRLLKQCGNTSWKMNHLEVPAPMLIFNLSTYQPGLVQKRGWPYIHYLSDGVILVKEGHAKRVWLVVRSNLCSVLRAWSRRASNVSRFGNGIGRWQVTTHFNTIWDFGVRST